MMESILKNIQSTFSVPLTIALVAVLLAYYILTSRGLPPGPVGLPYLGIWPFLSNQNCIAKLDAYKKKYGDVYSFTSTGRLYINLGSVKAVREAHITRSDCFAERNDDYTLFTLMFGDGFAFSNGESWKVLRKFFLQVLKQRGITTVTDSVSGFMCDYVKATTDVLKCKGGEPLNIHQLLMKECRSILRRTLFGESGTTDEKIKEINEYYAAVTSSLKPVNTLLSGNVAKYFIFPLYSSHRAAMENQKHAQKALYQIINEHKSTYDEENIRDIIDEFFKEKDLRRSKGDSTARYFTDKALVGSLLQFVGDGVSSIAIFIAMCLKCAIDHPEEQEKIHQEIVEVVGTDRQPAIEDKPKLTYTNAFLLEVLRTSDFFPIFPSLECTKETSLRGYRIPEGAITLVNMWSVHMDKEVYYEPEKFNPSRFLNAEGKRRPELPITFGIGKRSCLGEGFVMMQVFLFLTAFVQKFQLKLHNRTEENTFDMLFSGKMMIKAHPRKST